MEALNVYSLLHGACRMLDDNSDHAIAAYVGLAMALMEEKYDISPEDVDDTPAMLPGVAKALDQHRGGSHA